MSPQSHGRESVRWRKSTRSSNQTDCVQVAHTLAAVRDSKNPAGPTLAVDAGALVAWARRCL